MIRSSINGIGMTSQRTRDRMLARLREQGVKDEVTLAAMGEIPRHIFIDEALATRAYEDVSLPNWVWSNHLAAIHRCPNDRSLTCR
ncbi:MAG: L-isoaspartate protein carboxylmethyltransferase type [Pseudomonadota bacterium]